MSDLEAGSPEPTAQSPVDSHREETPIRDDASETGSNADNVNDKDSDLLSEINEDEFEDYDPETANIEDRPVEIDEDVARTLKASKRQVADGEKKKPKEGRREKKRPRDEAAGATADGDRPRKRRGDAEKKAPRPRSASPVEELTPEERRARALARQLEAAVKGPQKRRRRKGDTDLDDPIDEQIASLVIKMEKACEADNNARVAGQTASQKVKMIDDVVSMLNRNTAQDAVLDPDTGFLRAVRYFLEPLSDGSLPAYDVQNKIFTQLDRLPIGKEQLLGSGLGKVVFFYTKSKKPVPRIKRMANKLVEDWSRPILKRTNDYKKRQVEERDYDYQAAKLAQRGSQFTLSQRPGPTTHELERERALAPARNVSLARAPELPASYSIAPRSNLHSRPAGMEHRPVGASGIDAFKRMTQKPKKR